MNGWMTCVSDCMCVSYGSYVFFAGDGVEEVEVDDAEVVELLDQFDDVSIGQADAGLGLLGELELSLQFQQFFIHFFFFNFWSETTGVDGICGAREGSGDGDRRFTASDKGRRFLPFWNSLKALLWGLFRVHFLS